MATQIEWLSARTLTAAYAKRDLSPVEVTRALLARIEALNGTLNALYLVDADGALAQAMESESRWRTGSPKGLLDGVPTTVKDALATKDMPTYRGSAAVDVSKASWTADAPAVSRLKDHGAIILGKTTMCDFGILPAGVSSKHGVTRNPWNTRRNTGGSSSGAAATVASGINPLAIGTDIVGSIRLPASFCGLFGHKPSQGRVPYYPPNSPALVAGPLTRDVDDALLFMDVLTGEDARDFTVLPRDGVDYRATVKPLTAPKRLGLITDLGIGLKPDPEVVAAVNAAAKLLAGLGFAVEAIAPPFKAGEDRCAEDFYRMRCLAEFSLYPEDWRRRAPVIERWTKPGYDMSAVDLYHAINRMTALRERTVRLMDGFDFLLLPAVPVPAYAAELPAADADDPFAPWCNTFLFNLSEQPGCSINCGYTKAGLPIGLQIVGKRFDDVGVLSLAKTYELARPDQRPWPQVPR